MWNNRSRTADPQDVSLVLMIRHEEDARRCENDFAMFPFEGAR